MTVEQARKLHPLAPAVLAQLGDCDDVIQSAIDAANHGADGGFGGFTYYVDTCAFTTANRAAIAATVEDMADQLGNTPFEMLRAFGCGDVSWKDSNLSAALYGGAGADPDEVEAIENALAWFALEEVGRAIADAAE